MAIAKVQSTAPAAFIGNSTTVTSGTATGYQRSLSVTAGSLLVASIFVANNNASGHLINAVTDNKGQTWTRRVFERDDSTENGYGYVYIYDCENAGAGTTTISLDFVLEDTNNHVVWDVTEYSGVASSSSFDISASGEVDGPSGTISITTNPTSTSQADTLTHAVMGSRWWWNISGTPSGYTRNNLVDGNTYGQFESVFKINSTQAVQGASWSGPAGQSTTDGTMAALAVYKAAGTTNLRVRATFDTAINGDSGITAYVWTTEPSSGTARKFEGLTAEASGGVLLINLPANVGYTNGQSVNVLAFNSSDTSGLISATIETY